MKTIPTALTIENDCELWGDLNGRRVRICFIQSWFQLDSRRMAALFAAAPAMLRVLEDFVSDEIAIDGYEHNDKVCDCEMFLGSMMGDNEGTCIHTQAHRVIAMARGESVQVEQPVKTVVSYMSEFKEGDRVQIVDRIHPHFPKCGTFVKYDQLWPGASANALIALDPGEGIGGTEGCYARKKPNRG